MPERINKNCDPGSEIILASEDSPDGDQIDRFFAWRPIDDDFVTFMTNGHSCHSCLHLRNELGHAPRLCLHVRQRKSLLIITHACDLHETGEVLLAQRIARYSRQSLYQLSSVIPDGMHIASFRPAAGVAVLFQRDGRRHLTIFGAFNSVGSPENYAVNAHEISITRRIDLVSLHGVVSRE